MEAALSDGLSPDGYFGAHLQLQVVLQLHIALCGKICLLKAIKILDDYNLCLHDVVGQTVRAVVGYLLMVFDPAQCCQRNREDGNQTKRSGEYMLMRRGCFCVVWRRHKEKKR
jgi:hypothetical protein